MKRTKHKKLYSIILAAAMTISSMSGLLMPGTDAVQAAENTAPEKPTDLKTEMLRAAYGIDTKNPAFSWVVNDADQDEVQSAYRIVVSQTSELAGDVLDTGWVNSDENSFVHAEGLEDVLKDNQLYYWQVQTKDKMGAASGLSDACPFMTDIASEWQSLNGIWAVPGSGLWTDYTLEAAISIQGGNAFGILMRMDGSSNGYMLQFRDADNVIKCHPVASGTVNATAFQTINLSDSGITLPTDQSEFKVKLTAEGTKIQVAVDTNAGDETDHYIDAGTIDLTQTTVVNAGMAGFRTGRYESGTVDDLKITDASGNTLYASDFTADGGNFSGCSVSGGKLAVGTSGVEVRSVWQDPEASELTERGNICFLRSPKLTVADTSKIEKVIVSAAARGTAKDRGTIFDIFFNGACIGAGSARELSNVGATANGSGYTQVYYNSYDVTDLIVQGNQNVISAVGNCRDTDRGILVQMTVFYKDGTKAVLTNSGTEDSGWKALDGTNAFGDTGDLITTGYVSLFHDNVNMNKYPAGWKEADFDDSGWQEAQVNAAVADRKTGTTGRVLYPNSSENALRFETDEPTKNVYQNTSGNVVVDLGKEIIGGLKVDITSAKAQSVTVHMGEEMDSNGTVKYQLTAVPVYEDTWTLKSGSNAFETITLRTFRYVELIGLDATTIQNILSDPDSIKGWAIQQEFDENESAFSASGSEEAELLNRLYELSKYTIKATNQDLFVDSQARERAPYEGDLLVNSNTSYAVSGNYSLARHSNEWLMDNPTWPNDYRLFSVEMSYWDYIYTGNTDSIEENYEALKKKLVQEVDYEDAATGLIRANDSQAGYTALIDWPTSERDGYTGSYYDVVFNAEYVGIYQYMAIICDALGEAEDAAVYRVKSEKLKESLLKYAYDEENGCFYDSLAEDYTATQHSSTHATAYALSYSVFDSEEMADAMCEFVYNNCKDEFKGSVYVTYFILKGLYAGNHGEMAQELMTNPKVGTDVKTFASLLDNLYCTITPEAWGHAHKSNMTLSHPWGASPGCSIVQGMFGILPTEAGFDRFSVKFQPGGIPSASVKTPTVKGAVYASFENGSMEDLAANNLEVKVTIPANSRADVYLPVSGVNYAYLLVDGIKTEAVYDGTYLSTEIGSGEHTVTVCKETVNAEDYFDLSAKTDATVLEVGKTAQITTTLVNRIGEELLQGTAVTYKSLNTDVAAVSEAGVIKGTGSGTAEVEITATYKNITRTVKLSVTVKAEQVSLTGMELNLSVGNTIAVGENAQAVLKAVYSNGKKECIDTEKVSYSVTGDSIEVDENGVTAGTKAGLAVLTAMTPAANAQIDRSVSGENVGAVPVWSFDYAESPLSGVTVDDGRLYAATGLKVTNTDSDKTGNVVFGTFEIENVAANIAFNVKDDNNRYFWQFRKEGILKRHKGNADVYGATVPITLNDGENSFIIATVDGRIYTWLNEELVDVCDADASMPSSGGFGVRNGMSESFWLSDISVGSGLSFKAEAAVKVTEEELLFVNSIQVLDPLTVSKGTTFRQLVLPNKVEVTLSDGSTRNAAVDWSGDYDASKVGTYSLEGTIRAGEDYNNRKELTAAITVVVEKDADNQQPDNLEDSSGNEGPGAIQDENSVLVPDTEGIVKTEQPTVKLNAKSLPLQVKKSTKVLKASGMIAGDKVKSWKSSKTSVATVNKSGKITAKKVGTATITVTTVKGATASCKIKVQKGKVKTKKLNVTNVTKKKLTLKKGKSFKLAVERDPLTATDKLSYSSSKKSVVTVSKSGKLTAKKKGKATVTVKSANGKSVKIAVTVK